MLERKSSAREAKPRGTREFVRFVVRMVCDQCKKPTTLKRGAEFQRNGVLLFVIGGSINPFTSTFTNTRTSALSPTARPSPGGPRHLVLVEKFPAR